MNADQIHNPTSIRILLADDHIIMRQGLSTLLGRQPELTIVAEANNGQEGIELFRKHRPDVLLTDIEMPLLDGITALAAIRMEYPDARGILLTMHAREGDILRAMRAGAMGYVLKDAPSVEIIQAIQAVMAGHTYLSPAVSGRLLRSQTPRPVLSMRECDILACLAKGHTNKQIAAELGLSTRTVETHRQNIRRKLNLEGQSELIKYAVENRGV